MKLNYRDKIIAAFLIAIAIFLIGFFALVKPKAQKIKTNNETLAAREATKAEIEEKINQIKPLQNQIMQTYEDTNKLAEIFVPVDEVTRVRYLDMYMQKFADENHVKLKNVELSSSSVAPINYYFSETKDDLGDARKAADIDGSLQGQYDAEHIESTVLSQRAKESVVQTQYGVIVNGTKANVWKYLKALKEFDKALTVNSVNFVDYSFGKDSAEAANVNFPENGNDDEGNTIDLGDGKTITDKSDVQIVITLYSVYEMAKPDVETAPAAK